MSAAAVCSSVPAAVCSSVHWKPSLPCLTPLLLYCASWTTSQIDHLPENSCLVLASGGTQPTTGLIHVCPVHESCVPLLCMSVLYRICEYPSPPALYTGPLWTCVLTHTCHMLRYPGHSSVSTYVREARPLILMRWWRLRKQSGMVGKCNFLAPTSFECDSEASCPIDLNPNSLLQWMNRR